MAKQFLSNRLYQINFSGKESCGKTRTRIHERKKERGILTLYLLLQLPKLFRGP